jgi:predicted ester cyclase
MKEKIDLSKKQTPERLVYEFFNSVWCPPNELDAIDELMTEDYCITTAGVVIKGRTEFKKWVESFQNILLEAKNEILDIFYNEEQNKVVSRWICSGKNNGLFALPANHEFISFSGIAIWTVRDGRLSECWVERSAFELYQSLKSEDEKKFI